MANKTIPEFSDKPGQWDDADLMAGFGTSIGLNIKNTVALFRQLTIFKTPTSSADATLSITSFGKYIHTGTGSTWTLLAGTSAIDGLPFVWTNKGSGNILLNNSAASLQTTIFPNATKQGYWDNTGSRWIIY